MAEVKEDVTRAWLAGIQKRTGGSRGKQRSPLRKSDDGTRRSMYCRFGNHLKISLAINHRVNASVLSVSSC
jgi:hypothetical protein